MSRVFVAVVLLVASAGCLPKDEPEAAVVVVLDDDVESSTPTGPQPDSNRPVGMPDELEGCVDADGDGWAVDCLDFGGVEPDCNDEDPNNWLACATCVDADGDGVFGVCDVYDGVDGPDCSDADPNSWANCSTCVDADGDGYFAGCDAFETVAEDCADDAPGIHAGASEVIGNGVDDDCNEATPDDCTYTPTPAVDPEPGMLAGMTRLHNLWRWRVGVPALQWDTALAADAQQYADACIWEHDPNRSPGGGFQYVGENLYATTEAPSQQSVVESVQAWADERFDFDFGFTTGQTTGGQVGHYTQMVWRDTTHVGCAFTRCNGGISGLSWPSGTMVVCRYGPGGNYTGEAPYDYQAGACLDLDNDDVWQAADADDTNRAL